MGTFVIPPIAVPHTAEVSAYQSYVLFCEALLLIEDFRLEAPEIAVEVACNINFHYKPPCQFRILSTSSPG
jgi:hypothetical protein